MKKICLTVLTMLLVATASAIEKSQTIVVINGSKYYVHEIKAGETLYSLSKSYGVGEAIIVENNPESKGGLKVDERLKIPYVVDAPIDVPERKLRKDFDLHFVEKGETLYAISRRYSIPIQTIIEDNKNIDPIHLRLGERILIRRVERGTEPATQVQEQWVKYKDNLNSMSNDGSAYHIVQSGETFYSLSRRFNMSEEQLSALNNGLKAVDLKAGAIIRIPNGADPSSDEKQVKGLTSGSFEDIVVAQPTTMRADFKPLEPDHTLQIALMIPIAIGSRANANYLEFYQGFLMGLDNVKRAGYAVNLTLFNTERDTEKVTKILQDKIFADVDLIVGPVYEECLAPVIELAERRNIPVVSPLANITLAKSDVLFQLAPVTDTKYDKVTDLISGDKKITLVYTDNTDKEFEAEILALLGDTPYKRRDFRYSVSMRGQSGSMNDLTPMLHNGDDNTFIIMADKEIDVDRILTAIASANTNISARGFTAPRFVVLGNNRWNRYNNIDRTMFFKNRVIFLSTYHAKRDNETVLTFDSNYIRSFGSLPTLYSYRGYDSAVLFGLAMYGDIQNNLEGMEYTPLQTSYEFKQMGSGENHANRNWMRVNYNSDFTITID